MFDEKYNCVWQPRNYVSREYYIYRMTAKTIKIQYLDESIPKLTYVGGKSDWIDLAAAETVVLKAGEFRLIHLGVAMKLPEGYEAHIAPRSSTFKNFGILQANSVGVVDSSYCGANDWWKKGAALRSSASWKFSRRSRSWKARLMALTVAVLDLLEFSSLERVFPLGCNGIE